MATVKEYIEAKLQRFNITISDVELAVYLTENQVSENDELTEIILEKVKKTFISIIPELLLISEVSEGDLTLKWNIDGIKAYYSMLCKDLGIEDNINSQLQIPVIVNKTNLW